MEIELKLFIQASDRTALRQHPLLKHTAMDGSHKRKLTSTYFDTPDFYLWRHHLTLRIRKNGRDWIQTLKEISSVESGLHQREEIEIPVSSSKPDVAALQEKLDHVPKLKKIVSNTILTDSLKPIFSTLVQRTTWQLILPSGDEIELALDE